MIESVEPGDEVLTVGGIYGIVEEIDEEDDLVVEIADEVRIARRAVASVVKPDDEEDEEPGEADEASGEPQEAEQPLDEVDEEDRVNDHDGAVRDEPPQIRPPHRAWPEAPVNRRSAVLVIGFIVAALVAVAAMAIPASPIHDDPTLGLDLQGGLENTLQAVPPKGRQLTEDDLNRSVEIMRDRVDKLGTAEPDIRTQGDDQIVIQLPGVKDPKRAAEVIGKTAQLELFDLEADLVSPSIDASTRRPVANDSVYSLLGAAGADRQRVGPVVPVRREEEAVAGPVGTREAALRKFDGKVPKGYRLFGVPPKTAVISCAAGDLCLDRGRRPRAEAPWYLMRFDPPKTPEMTGADLQLRGTRQDFDPQTAQPIVLIDFTGKGEDKFRDITRAEAQRGKLLYNTQAARAPTPTPSTSTSRSSSTARSSPGRRSTSTTTRTASPAGTAPRSRATSPSARRVTSRSCSRPARCRSSSSRSTRPRSLPRWARTRSRRRRSPSSRACCSSRSSCSSSTASWASSRSSGSGCTRRCSTRRS